MTVIHHRFTKRRSNFEGLTLKALIEMDEPLTKIKSKYKTYAPYFPQNQTYLVNEFTSGLFLEVWDLLEEHFNFTTRLYKPLVTNWGNAKLFPNGTLVTSGMIASIHQQEVDVLVAPRTMNPTRLLVLDYLPPLNQEMITIAIPRASVREHLDFTTFLKPLHMSLWIAILLTALLISILKTVFDDRKKYFLLTSYRYWWDSLRPFFGGASSSIGSSTAESYNILILTSLLSGFIIWISYNAELTSELLVVEKSYPFTDLESVALSNWR